MIRIRHSIASILAAGFSLAAGAQLAEAQDCESVLLYARETYANNSELTTQHNFARYYCERTEQQVSSSNNNDSGFGLGIPIEEFPIEFNGHQKNDSSNSSLYKKELCESVANSSNLDQKTRIAVQKTNEAVVNAWSRCIGQPGVRFWADINLDTPYTVILKAQYNPMKGSPEIKVPVKAPAIEVSPPEAADCDHPKIGQLVADGLTSGEIHITCNRLSEQGFNVTLNSPNNRTISIPSLGEASCSSNAEVVDTLISNLFPAGEWDLNKDRENWMGALRQHHSVQKLMAAMFAHPLYVDWTIGASLGANATQPEPLKAAYSWMVNNLYYSQLGRLSSTPEAEAFYAAMPPSCSPTDVSDACHTKFVEQARLISMRPDWARNYNDGRIPQFDATADRRNVIGGVRYCPGYSECKTNLAWCHKSGG